MTPWRVWSLASTAATTLTTAIYLIAITMEGNNSAWDVFPWALLMVVGAAASLCSALSSDARPAGTPLPGGAPAWRPRRRPNQPCDDKPAGTAGHAAVGAELNGLKQRNAIRCGI
jgi:hypothetical protein